MFPAAHLLASNPWIPGWVVVLVLGAIVLGIPALIMFLIAKLSDRPTAGATTDRFRKRDWVLMGVVMLAGWYVDCEIDDRRHAATMNKATKAGTLEEKDRIVEQEEMNPSLEQSQMHRPSLTRHVLTLAIAIGGARLVRMARPCLGPRFTWCCLTGIATLAFVQCMAILERLWHG